MQDKFDVVILGGGLAGLCTAKTILKNTNISVLIIDNGYSSVNNPTRLTFKDTIEKFELTDSILTSYNNFLIRTVNGFESHHKFDSDILVALDYQRACNILKEKLYQFKSTKILKGKAQRFYYEDNYVKIETNNNLVFTASILIDATGKKHFVLSNLNKPKPSLYSHSFGMLYDNCVNLETNKCYFIAASKRYGSGGGWFYPISQKKASVGFAIVNQSERFPAKELKQNFRKAIKQFYPFSSFLKDANPLNFEIGTIPVENVDNFVYKQIVLIGDSVGHATPWMCMGVEPILISGELAGNVVRKAVEIKNFDEQFLSEYQKGWERLYKKPFGKFKNDSQKIWFLDDEVWDFLILYDVNKLSSDQMLVRMRGNGYLMSRKTALRRWFIFKLKKKLGILKQMK